MTTDPITFEIDGKIGRITFNRPGAFNAIDSAATMKLHEIVNNCYSIPELRAVILTGAGQKAFCAGGDVAEFASDTKKFESHLREMTTYLHVAISRLAWLPVPVIAAVNGVAAGAGLSFVACCDLALSSDTATFTSAYTKIGLTPDGSSTFFLPRLIGRRRVLELYLTNRVLSAEEAMEWGLINAIVPDANLAIETEKLAQKLADGPTQAFAGVKKLVMMSPNDTLESQMELETRSITAMARTPDGLEGIKAFSEKRKPNFSGKPS